MSDRPAAYRALTKPPALSGSARLGELRKAVWNPELTNAAWFRAVLADAAEKAGADPSSAHLERLAAEGLGRLRDGPAVPLLLNALQVGPQADGALRASLIMALIEIARPAETRVGLGSGSLSVQRGALVALDQMEGGDLRATDVLPFLRRGDEVLRHAALWVFHRHPAWASESGGLAEELLASHPAGPEEQDAAAGLLQVLSVAPAVQICVAKRIASAPTDEQLRLFRAVSLAQPSEFAPEWVALVRTRLGDQETRLVRAAVNAARDFQAGSKKASAASQELTPILLGVAADDTRPADLRLDALLAMPGRIALTNAALIDLGVTNLEASLPTSLRAAALEVVQRAHLDAAGLRRVAAAIPRVSPLELPRLLAVFDKQTDAGLGHQLLRALSQSTAARSVPPGNVRTLFAQYPEEVRLEAAAFIQSLNVDTAQEAAQLESVLAELQSLKGDTRRGQALFNSPKAACTACHKMGYLGGEVGPDLTSIGQARSERDLVEAIVYPSASFVRGYEPVVISTRAGEEYSGVLRRDTPTELVVATGPNAEAKIPRADVAELRPGRVSVMPQGFAEQLSRQELANLVAFLKNTKWGPQ